MDLQTLTRIAPWEWPPETEELLIETLRDRRNDISDRVLAADLAGALPEADDEIVDVLLDVVRNPAEPDEVRAAAAISLGPILEETEIEGFDDDVSEPPIRKETFEETQETLHRVYAEEATPKEVRRRAFEASVRSPQAWHSDAIRTAYRSGDEEWKLTAIFGMRWVAGFEKEIMESLGSRNSNMHLQAVQAAGSQEVGAAWPHVSALVRVPGTEKVLLLAAIETAGVLRPGEARSLFEDLIDSEDEDIAAAVDEAIMMADAQLEHDFDDEEEDEGDGEEEGEGGYVN